MHVDVVLEPGLSVQVLENVPLSLVERATLPVGVEPVPGELSVTVAVQDVGWFTTIGVAHARPMLVVRLLTLMLVPELVLPV